MYGWTEPIDDDGRDRPTPGEPTPYRASPTGSEASPAGLPDPERATGRRRGRPAGRHRTRRRTPTGPLVLGAVVTVLLVMLGATAALLPANFTGGNDRGTPAARQGAAGGAGEEAYGLLDEAAPEPAAPPSARPTASPSPSRTPAARTPTPTRKSTTATSRSTRQATTGNSGGGGSAASREEQVVAIVNRERAAAGCGAVRINAQLATAARRHSADQAATNTMSHTGSDGSDFVARARRAGYQSPIGENVAMGYRTPEAVMEGWMNSDGHRRNILNCQAKAIGVGVATASDGSLYWTQVFGATA